MTWEDLLEYLCTFSSLHTFHEKYPDDLKHPEGDIAARFWHQLKADVAANNKSDVPKDTDEIDIEWPLALILARRV